MTDSTPASLPSATLDTEVMCDYTPNTSLLKEKSRNFLVHCYSGSGQEQCPRLSDLCELGMTVLIQMPEGNFSPDTKRCYREATGQNHTNKFLKYDSPLLCLVVNLEI